MTLIVDKRLLPKNQISGSRQKFIDRYKASIKKKVKDIIKGSSIKKLKDADKKVKIRVDNLDEPEFQFENGTGNTDRIYIGNKTFKKGQEIKRNSSGQSQGVKGGNGSGGEDEFEFMLTEKEFSDLLFEDLELPELIKKQLSNSCYEIQHAGYSRSGGPSSLNVRKTMMNSIGRRVAIKNKCELCKQNVPLVASGTQHIGRKFGELNSECINKKKKIQYIEDLDLRYNFKDRVEVPSTQAVMFALMDVSGSMSEKSKDMAKRFYILLNMFLERNYDTVEIVFIRHSEHAEEVEEDVFFHDRATGGTIISTGYDKILEIIRDRYAPEQWNIYIAQASDGDNWDDDMVTMENTLTRYILPLCQYFAYVDIQSNEFVQMFDKTPIPKSGVLEVMERLMSSNKNLQARTVQDYRDIFPVFRSLFKKEK